MLWGMEIEHGISRVNRLQFLITQAQDRDGDSSLQLELELRLLKFFKNKSNSCLVLDWSLSSYGRFFQLLPSLCFCITFNTEKS